MIERVTGPLLTLGCRMGEYEVLVLAAAVAYAAVLSIFPLAAVFSVLAPWLFSALAFLIMYRFLPNARVSRPALFAGAAVAVVLFEGAKRLFIWHRTTLAGYPVVYGPIAGLVVFMVWVYLASVLALLGAEVMALFDRRPGVRVHG